MLDLKAKGCVIEQKTTDVSSELEVDNQVEPIEGSNLDGRPSYLLQYADLPLRVLLFAPAYPGPNRRPILRAPVRHKRMIA